MTEIYHIALMIKFVLKRKLIARPLANFSAKFIILVIADLRPFSDPTYFPLLVANHGKHIRLHPQIEKGVLFTQINNVNFQREAFGNIFDHKEKPLVISFRIYIVL